MSNKETVENSGGACSYYRVPIAAPATKTQDPYIAECLDVMENLEMTYAEANMFKEIWRTAAARTLGKKKAGHDAIRGAEKIVYFAQRHYITTSIKAQQEAHKAELESQQEYTSSKTSEQ